MPVLKRKVELHKLTISGVGDDTDYAALVRMARGQAGDLSQVVLRSGGKSHALYSADVAGTDLRLRFMSFTTGHRPDILDTQDFSVEPNPLPPNTTGVEWTHVLGRNVEDRFVLALERFQAGIWPATVERYLQWLIDENLPDLPNVVISIEAIPGERFIQRLNALHRITKATVRTVRPNPGWPDFETELASESEESDAKKTDVTMTARRNGSLNKQRGIVGAIKSLFGRQELDYAAVEGTRGDARDAFNTQRLGKSATVEFPLDAQGQVRHDIAWRQLGEVVDEQV